MKYLYMIKMWASLVAFIAILWVQIADPAASLQISPSYLLDSVGESASFNALADKIDGLQLYERDLGDEAIPELDVDKVINAFKRMNDKTRKTVQPQFDELIETTEDTLLSQLFKHILFLIQNRNHVAQYPRKDVPPTNLFNEHCTKEGLLVAVEEMNDESVGICLESLDKLVKQLQRSDLLPLIKNIRALIGMHDDLKRYGQLCSEVDKAFGLDKPVDFKKLGVPVPSEKEPVKYFELKDDRIPNTRCFVKVELHDDSATETIIIRNDPEDPDRGYSLSTNSFTVPIEELEDLYRKLPITHGTKVV